MKKCKLCQTTKNDDDFYKDKSTSDKLFSWCKSCCQIKREERKIKNENLVIDYTKKKICSVCKIEKYLSEFSKNLHSSQGLLASCKECECKKQKIVRKENITKNQTIDVSGEKLCFTCNVTKPKTQFHLNRINPDGLCNYCKKCFKDKRISYLKKDLRRFLLSSAKYRAKKKGLEFNLVKDDIKIPKLCPIFNIPLHYSEGGKDNCSPTIDRIDNTKGYIKRNIVVISFKANRIKSDATVAELQRLVDFYKQIPTSQ